jgi:hypothetical protein
MITQQELKESLELNTISWEFTWKKPNLKSTKKIGDIAGYFRNDGYGIICLNRVDHYIHKLVYLWCLGIYPDYVDHLDGNPRNNNIDNLREASHKQNMHNQKLSKANSTGVKGVVWSNWGKRYIATIDYEGKSYTKSFSVGKYKEKEIAMEAAKSYIVELRNSLHKEFANHG